MKDALNLPACELNSPPAQSQAELPQRILVVEDDSAIRQLNTEVLIRFGYHVDAAEDGVAAWEALNADGYDLMITDNNMPNVSGLELLKKLRAARMDLPVIMATGTVPTEEFTRYPWLRPAATLLKPYTAEEMLRMVKIVLSGAEIPADSPQLVGSREVNDDTIPQRGAPAAAPRQAPANSPHRILVVDEDSDLRRLYAEALAGPGYHVDGAHDGVSAWEALQTRPYSLLITEHDIPKLTGVELVRKLRAARMAVPVVMAAGRLPTHALAQDASLQVAATLSKPFPVAALLATVNNVLRATDGDREQLAPPPIPQGDPSAGELWSC